MNKKHMVCVINFDTIADGEDLHRILFALVNNNFKVEVEKHPDAYKIHPEYGGYQLIVSKENKI